MKKKKQRTAAAASGGATRTSDLKAIVEAHSVFFDRLVELIPAKFYLPPDDDVSEKPKPYFHGLSKAAKASLKRQSKQNLKLARRDRLDPDKIPHSSTLDILQKSIETSRSEITEIPPTAAAESAINLEGEGDKKSATYEELREKLRKKIELLRGNRGEKPKENNNRNRNREDIDKKRKRGDGGEESSSGKDMSLGKNEDEEEVIEYGKVRLGRDDDKPGKKKRKKMPKAKELERATRLKEVKRENPRVAEREWWKTAENRAKGVKVHDDPKLLRESIKKEKRRREKNAEKWKERTDGQEKAKAERQQKRKENITGRIKEKKMRKIAKREKKLMRPGFEGRKDNYITNG